jgi:hypothetical protein
MASMNRTALGYWTIIDSVLRPSKYHEGEYTYITMQNAQGDIVHTNIEMISKIIINGHKC